MRPPEHAERGCGRLPGDPPTTSALGHSGEKACVSGTPGVPVLLARLLGGLSDRSRRVRPLPRFHPVLLRQHVTVQAKTQSFVQCHRPAESPGDFPVCRRDHVGERCDHHLPTDCLHATTGPGGQHPASVGNLFADVDDRKPQADEFLGNLQSESEGPARGGIGGDSVCPAGKRDSLAAAGCPEDRRPAEYQEELRLLLCRSRHQ